MRRFQFSGKPRLVAAAASVMIEAAAVWICSAGFLPTKKTIKPIHNNVSTAAIANHSREKDKTFSFAGSTAASGIGDKIVMASTITTHDAGHSKNSRLLGSRHNSKPVKIV